MKLVYLILHGKQFHVVSVIYDFERIPLTQLLSVIIHFDGAGIADATHNIVDC